MNDGSVAKLQDYFITKEEKKVFKTFREIDQRKLVQLAADIQNYIDQGQSLNLCFNSNVHVKDLYKIHLEAWKKGLKTLYYCRSDKIAKADKFTGQVVNAFPPINGFINNNFFNLKPRYSTFNNFYLKKSTLLVFD